MSQENVEIMRARWRRGRMFWWAHFDTPVEALEAVGLSEHDTHAHSA